jgi:anti-sigma factor ChrR (cupin superfamily)
MGWVRKLFAFPRTAALADPKLEAIRRLAVVAHLGVDDELVEEEHRAQASGVGHAQMATVLARFGRPAFMHVALHEPQRSAAA